MLLTNYSTGRAQIRIPPRARVLVVQIQGYPAGSAWPIVRIDMGGLGRRTLDAYESRAQARPFFFVLPESAGGGTAELSASLLNAGAGLSALITEISVF
jgi:hypothetical protein